MPPTRRLVQRKRAIFESDSDEELSIAAAKHATATRPSPNASSRGEGKGAGMNSTPARKAASTSKVPKVMGPAGFAREVMQHDTNEDPKPIRRALPKQFEDADWTDDEEKSEIDNGDSSTDEEPGSEDENDGRVANSTKKRPYAHPDDSDDGMSPGYTRAAPRRVAPVLSKAAMEANMFDNDYAGMLALQAPSAAGMRNDILFSGRIDDLDRALELEKIYNLDLPRGIVPEDGDLDFIMRFPRPPPVMTPHQREMTKKMTLQANELRKNRKLADIFPETRMQFHSDIESPDQIALDLIYFPDRAVPADPDAAPEYKYPNGRGSNPRVVKKLGSRSKLGPVVPKRAYNWKDPAKEKVRAVRQAKKLAVAVLEDRLAPPKAPLPRKRNGAIDRYPKREA